VGCHFLLQCMKVKSESEVAQSCLTLCDPMDCRLPSSSIHGIFQATVLEWGAIVFSADGDYSHKIIRHLLLGRKAISILKLDSILKTDITLLTNVRLVKAVVFPVVMYGRELDRKGRALKNWCFRTVVLGKTPESPLDRKEIKPVNEYGSLFPRETNDWSEWRKLTRGLYELNACVSPKCRWWNPTLQCDGLKKWTLWG